MRNPGRRDETTLQIFTALLLFVGVLVVGGVLLGFVGTALGVAEPFARWLFAALACAAAAAAVAYLVRRRGDGQGGSTSRTPPPDRGTTPGG